MTKDEINNDMSLEAYLSMQQEAGKQFPDLKRLSCAHRAMSETGDQELKEAYAIECKMRMMLQQGLIR